MQNIELRSEKIRKAIGKKPGFWLTWGTTIIAALLVVAAVIVFYFWG